MAQSTIERIRAQFPDAVVAEHAQHGDDTAIVKPERVLDVIRFLKEDPELAFVQFIDLTAFDTLGLDGRTLATVCGGKPLPGRFHVVYHLRSVKSGHRVRIKSIVDGEGVEDGEYPEIDSISSLYKAANWAEREVWDMYGVKFRGHPDLRRLLMYEEFIGHPLRKDYPKEKRQPLIRRDFT